MLRESGKDGPSNTAEAGPIMPTASFAGLRVLALESRRAREIEKLIATYGGQPIVVPSVREVPLESNQEALQFAQRLADHQLDMVIFTTGVGVRVLSRAVESVYSREQFASLLSGVTVVARGPKPGGALKELGVQASVVVPEPNTWRDLLVVLDEKHEAFPLRGSRVAVQEYGVTNPELSAALEQRGATVTSVNVYEWALPEDTRPLQGVVASLLRGEIDVVLIMSAVQIRHLVQVAKSMDAQEALRNALNQVVIVSIGPLASEELQRQGMVVDFEPSRPKMGFLVQEAAEKSPALHREKRGIASKTLDVQFRDIYRL